MSAKERNSDHRLGAEDRRCWRYGLCLTSAEYAQLREFAIAAGLATLKKSNIGTFVRETAMGKQLRGKRDFEAIEELLRLRVYWMRAIELSGRAGAEPSAPRMSLKALDRLAQAINAGKLPFIDSLMPSGLAKGVRDRQIFVMLGDRERVQVMGKAYQAGYGTGYGQLSGFMRANALKKPPQSVCDRSMLQELRDLVRDWFRLVERFKELSRSDTAQPEAHFERHRELERLESSWKEWTVARFGENWALGESAADSFDRESNRLASSDRAA